MTAPLTHARARKHTPIRCDGKGDIGTTSSVGLLLSRRGEGPACVGGDSSSSNPGDCTAPACAATAAANSSRSDPPAATGAAAMAGAGTWPSRPDNN